MSNKNKNEPNFLNDNEDESFNNSLSEVNNKENNHITEDNNNKNNASTKNSTSEDEQVGKTPLPEKYNIKFALMCKLFAKLGTIKPKQKITCIKNFIDHCFKEASNEKISLFQFFRLLFPKLDRLRSTYGIAEVFISKLYVDILQLPQKEKLMLKHWKNPNFIPSPAPVGDYVGLIKFIINTRVTDKSTFTINDVNESLTNLSNTRDQEERKKILTKIIKECTAEEQKWIISIILKDLKIGLSQESFFKNFDIRAVDIYNSTSSLVSVCEYLSDPTNQKYSQTYYQLFSPIKPMLVARMTLDNIFNTFQGVKAIIETKFDGERIQCHLNENEVKFFTRNGIDYTNIYGPKFEHLIKASVNAKSVILDGEIVVYDKVNKKYAPFGDNKTIAKEKVEGDKCLVYEIFDIIYLMTPDGKIYSLNNVILSDRKKVLSKIITPIPKKIEIVLGIEINSIDEIMTQFNLALQRAEEGIVIKKIDSIYKPDKRCSDWVKMKCDYIDTIVDTLDLIIIGGYYGEGKRTNINNSFNYSFQNSQSINNIINDNSYSDSVTTFLMGIIKYLDKQNPKNCIILPLVKVGTGYNMETLSNIRNKLRPHWKKYDTKSPPFLYGKWTPAMGERPNVYIEDPSNSIILEVKAAEIVPTETFPSKVTLRFPRVVKTRFDKVWYDALQYDELIKLYDISVNNVKKNNETYKNDNDGNVVQHKHIIKKGKRKNIMGSLQNSVDSDISSEDFHIKKNKKNEKYSTILPSFRDTDTTFVNKVSNLFQGFQFLVLLLDDSITVNSNMKTNLEFLIVEHGGEKVQNYLSSVTHIIGNKIDYRAQNIIKVNDKNILKSKWVEDCVKYKKIIKISPKYLTYTNEETKEAFQNNFDEYGDSYYEELDQQTLDGIMENMKIKNVDKEYDEALNNLLKEYGDNEEFKSLMIPVE